MHRMMYLKALVLYLLTLRITAARPESGQTSVGFPVYKYHDGYYTQMRIGRDENEKKYSLAIGSSTLTWIRSREQGKGYYTPVPGKGVTCGDPICGSVQESSCAGDECTYLVAHGDYGSSKGLLVHDSVHLSLGGTEATPTLAFGCGLHQDYYTHNTSYVDGVVGLGKGEASILAQLSKMKVTKNIVGHCFNQTSIGFLFFGDQFVPKSGIAWTKISNRTNRYLGKADLQYDGNDTISKGLKIEFDSGSHYNSLCGAAYGALITRIYTDSIELNRTIESHGPLSMCWKRVEPFKSIQDAASYFKPLALRFGEKVQFVLPPESYLVVLENGDVCLGILTSATDVIGKNRNVIGAISMQDRIVVYDNENSRVGWADDCSSLFTTS